MNFVAEIDIMPHAELLDPQGKTVAKNMKNIDLKGIENVRIGKHVTMSFVAEDDEEANEKVEMACKKLLANMIMETYHYEITNLDQPKIAPMVVATAVATPPIAVEAMPVEEKEEASSIEPTLVESTESAEKAESEEKVESAESGILEVVSMTEISDMPDFSIDAIGGLEDGIGHSVDLPIDL